MMMQHPVGILILLVLGAVAFVVTTVNLALPLGATLYFIRREKGPAGQAQTSGLTSAL